MKHLYTLFLLLFLISFSNTSAQNSIIDDMVKEASSNSDLERLAHELLDVVGPRLVGTPQMQHASQWAIEQYKKWGIEARQEQYGTWRGWERGITHIDMISPRIQTLDGMQLAWNPSTGSAGVTAEVITLPENVKDSLDFKQWLPNVKGKFVLVSMKQPTGRPDYNWEEFATEESFTKMKDERDSLTMSWRTNLRRTGFNRRSIIRALEDAGAAGIVASNWSRGFGVNKYLIEI